MTRKDFQLIAEGMRTALRPIIPSEKYDEAVHAFTKVLSSACANFNEDKFVAACHK